MEEDKPGGSVGGVAVGSGESSSSKPTSSFLKSGDRQVFAVELRPGETTYVSWKKLVKDANKANSIGIGSSKSAPDPQPVPRPNIESRISPGQPADDKSKDEPAPNRFSAVIEKIERLYMGKDSSDDEELDDIPDDDQYDTEDSFIDDAELDEYFEVDNSAIKHDGFFVNRGRLERITEPTVTSNQQQKKRRRKDMAKAHGENDDGRVSNKHVKLTKTAATKSAPLVGKNLPTQNLAATSIHYEDVRSHNQLNASGIPSKKKSADYKTSLDSSSLKVSNGDASVSLAEAKDVERLKTGVLQSKYVTNKLKDISGPSDASHQKYLDQSAHAQSKSQSSRPQHNVDELEASVRQRDKNGSHELSEIIVHEGKYPMQITKASHMHRKDGSSVRPKGSMLEKAIRELEKMVAESRPPAMENQEADNSSQAVKRRLPREIKLKLAKVARLAASQGKISKELINRLMSILGHLIQLRTLKRNLKIMINMGLSAKQEKDNRFQQIKKEVVEMIKERVPALESKVLEQQAGSSDDFQEIGSEEKGVVKRKHSMDSVLEDKICDLYDLYVDGLDEDAGPQIRKLYVELAELWPKGFMDNHGIKRAICRAKERRRELYNRHKEQEKIKRKKMLVPKIEETVRVEASSNAQPQYMRERLVMDSGTHNLVPANKPISNTTTAAMKTPSPSANALSLDRLKQEKSKGSSSNSTDEAKMVIDGTITKKKVKRKPEQELDGTYFHPEKLPAQLLNEERHKSHKQQTATLPQKLNLQSTAATATPPNFEQSS
ncbi:Wound-responsive family protein, putative isoform 1 [Melia azedarach]|uniref:Wound-responsive family protein, putative isoform 1 n=1 Tax=Melia azedarach TaxID=155640 RepID=A0ACC1WNY3_MELAZ|nr:Wound-responsive family protein, putative isoform 1 [Melia azedarach]